MDGVQRYRDWHTDYRSTFCAVARNASYSRHHFATFILTNFGMYEKAIAGLSGLFQPVDPKTDFVNQDIQLSRYGRRAATKDDNDWYGPGDPPPEHSVKWQWRAYAAGLKPIEERDDFAVRIFGFTIPRMLRDTSLWDRPPGPGNCKVLLARLSKDRHLKFSDWNKS